MEMTRCDPNTHHRLGSLVAGIDPPGWIRTRPAFDSSPSGRVGVGVSGSRTPTVHAPAYLIPVRVTEEGHGDSPAALDQGRSPSDPDPHGATAVFVAIRYRCFT